MAALKDSFKAVNAGSGIIVTFERIASSAASATFSASWNDCGIPRTQYYEQHQVEGWLDNGYIFEVKNTDEC